MHISFPKGQDRGPRQPYSEKVTAWGFVIAGLIFVGEAPVVGILAILLGIGIAFRSASDAPPVPFTKEWHEEIRDFELWKVENGLPDATKAEYREIRSGEQTKEDGD